MRRLLLTIPLFIALAGPWLASDSGAVTGTSYDPGGGWLGTDFAGRDVWQQILLGGRTLVVVAFTATAGAYLFGALWGLTAATARSRLVDEALMRPLDLLLAVPALFLMLLLATLLPASGLTWIVMLIHLPDVARLVRATALEAAHGPLMDALRMQGESWWRTTVRHVGGSAARVVAADAGTRLTGTLYLVAAASFLGIGVAPDAADWAVMIERNRAGTLLNPWAALAPALMIIMLSVGLNLAFDRALRSRT
ncbi:peptide/nickel transport system permease protein [Actinocorallia herbida]|uniref:Peptide/nickel transport system permease protein n=1 Tax=Actinocorallia herbida TaxID=58109 RepID=A0A3N1D2G4_9ACTN|nr:ABC transporter permease subunit [Actinocorallia herbida]ROO87702.1 peptide/nickel transport system permease protein [Actinocorallia herbida]